MQKAANKARLPEGSSINRQSPARTKSRRNSPSLNCWMKVQNGESDVEALCDDSSGSEVSEIEERQFILQPSFADLNIDDHILVKFATKCAESLYVGHVVSIAEQNDDVETTFMRRQKTAKCERVQLQFCFPETPDKSTHDLQDVVMKFPVPTAGQTKRSAKLYDFHCHTLSKYHIN